MQTSFADLKLDLPDGWTDITADLPKDTPPTLARADGAGAIQFSVERYGGAATPMVTSRDLVVLAHEFCAHHGFDGIEVAPVPGGRSLCSGGSAEAVGVWYLSDGRNIALVTYVCSDPNSPAVAGELADAVRLVKSVTF